MSSGDPFALAMTGLFKVYDAWNKSNEVHEANMTPQKERGLRYGYVRHGNTWYPSVLTKRITGEGIESTDEHVDLNYGDAIYFKTVNVDGVAGMLAVRVLGRRRVVVEAV